ncbi:MAG: S41 family peptidase [Bryobacteraceae bacterium]
MVLSKKFGYVGIVDSIPGSPAAKAGLTTGDVIESINGVATRDMPLAFADILLEGEAGSTVEIGILRARKPEPTKIKLIREIIQYPAVEAKMAHDGVGVITVSSLGGGEVQQVAAKVADLEKQGAKKLVLDLRDCATGSPEQGIALANLFLDKGLITYTQGQKDPRKDFDAQSDKAIWHDGLVVITDRGTADGAEVAAAALEDNKRAEIVGERTYGDAAVRKAITMDDGAAVILSVAKYYSPGNKAIQDTGVTPTVAMLETQPADLDQGNGAPETTQQPKSTEDKLLEKAIDVALHGNHEVAKGLTNRPNDGSNGKVLTPLNVPEPEQH